LRPVRRSVCERSEDLVRLAHQEEGDAARGRRNGNAGAGAAHGAEIDSTGRALPAQR